MKLSLFFHVEKYSKTNFGTNPSVQFRSGTNVEFIGQDFRQTSGEANNQDVCVLLLLLIFLTIFVLVSGSI